MVSCQGVILSVLLSAVCSAPLGRSVDGWLELFNSGGPQQRLLAAHVLAVHAPGGPPLQLARDHDPAVRYWFAKAVRYRTDVTAAAVEECERLLADKDPVVRVAAAAALAARDKSGEAVVEAFRDALRHRQPGIRLEALTYLFELPELAQAVEGEIQTVLAERNTNPYEVTTLAQKVLARAGQPRDEN